MNEKLYSIICHLGLKAQTMCARNIFKKFSNESGDESRTFIDDIINILDIQIKATDDCKIKRMDLWQ